MTNKQKGTLALKKPSVETINYQLLRNTTSPDETSSGVSSYVANLPAHEIICLNTDSNLRNYIAEYNPRKRNRVHDAIRDTIEQNPERFISRNGGIVITASKIKVDDKEKRIHLTKASIINGAQTQGEIKKFYDDFFGDEQPTETLFHVRAEIIIDTDHLQVVETAISRNTATPVKSISQAGARGHLDDLSKSIKSVYPDRVIKKSETDDEGLDPIRIIQYARLLMPADIANNSSSSETLRPYKNPAQCLADFSDWFENKDKDEGKKRKYDFTVSIAPFALREYEFWESHESWNSQRLWEETKKGGRAVKRNAKGNIIWVAPGILFPLLSAMSEFVKEDDGRWSIEKPRGFKPTDMIRATVKQFRGYDSDPMSMGRSEAAYDALRLYPQTLMEVLRDMAIEI